LQRGDLNHGDAARQAIFDLIEPKFLTT
jgi:hypothetical protein